MRDPDDARDAEVCDGMGGYAAHRRDSTTARAVRADRARRREIAMTVQEPVYSVWRGEGDDRQLVHRTARQLIERELIALPEPQRRIALRSIGCTLEPTGDGFAVVSV